MSEMTIDEVKALKDELTEKVCRMFNKFEERTGTKIEYVAYERVAIGSPKAMRLDIKL